MAGDWIKLEHATPDKPEVVQMAASLGIDQDAVVGKLVRLWIWGDQQSVDGNDLGVTDSFLDRFTFCPGFAVALRKVGWLSGRDGRLVIPKFSRHNGQTAKQRANTQKRVAKSRNGAGVTNSLPEKRREENKKTGPVTAGPKNRRKSAETNDDSAEIAETSPEVSDGFPGPWTRFAAGELGCRQWTEIEPERSIEARNQCWSDAWWDDAWIEAGLRSTDAGTRNAARRKLMLWFRRQLGAPDPVISEGTLPAAVVMLAIAAEAAKRPGLTSPVGWFRTTVTEGKLDRIAGSNEITVAAKWAAQAMATAEPAGAVA